MPQISDKFALPIHHKKFKQMRSGRVPHRFLLAVKPITSFTNSNVLPLSQHQDVVTLGDILNSYSKNNRGKMEKKSLL